MPILHQHLCPKLRQAVRPSLEGVVTLLRRIMPSVLCGSRFSAPLEVKLGAHISCLRAYSEFDAYDPAMHTAQRPLQATCSSRIEITGFKNPRSNPISVSQVKLVQCTCDRARTRGQSQHSNSLSAQQQVGCGGRGSRSMGAGRNQAQHVACPARVLEACPGGVN